MKNKHLKEGIGFWIFVIIILTIFTLVFTSCKKTHECYCTDDGSTYYIKGKTKKQAKEECNDETIFGPYCDLKK